MAAIWLSIAKYTNADNKRPFPRLAMYCLCCVTLLVSKAIVEWVFSTVTSVKTKARNHRSLRMLDAVLRIGSHLCFVESVVVR